MANGIRDKVAILGHGMLRFGERWDTDADRLMVESYSEALADAGIETDRIDAAWLAVGFRRREYRSIGHPGSDGAATERHRRDEGRELLCVRDRSVSRRGLCGGQRRVRHRAGDRRRKAQGHRLRRSARADTRHHVRYGGHRRIGAGQLRAARLCLPRRATASLATI